MFAVELVLSLINLSSSSHLSLVIMFALVTLLMVFAGKSSYVLNQVLLYLEVVLVLFITGSTGLISARAGTAVSFVVLLASIPAIWVATPLSVCIINTTATVIYLVLAFKLKDPQYLRIDLCNVIIFSCYGLAIHYFLGHIRLRGMLERTGLLSDNERDQDILRNIMAGIAICAVDRSGNLRMDYFSNRWLEMFGWTLDEAKEYYRGDAMHGVDSRGISMIKREIPRIKDGSKRTLPDFSLKDGGGQVRWVSVDVSRVGHADGTSTLYLVYRDMTNEHRLRTERDAAERRFRVTLENSGLYLWDYDLEHDRAICAENTATFLDSDPVIENFPESMFERGKVSPETEDAYRDMSRRLKEGEDDVESEAEIVDIDGIRHWFHIRYELERDFDGKPMNAIGVAIEVTHQKMLERRYEELKNYGDTLAGGAMAAFRMDLTDNTFSDIDGEPLVVKRLEASGTTADDLMKWILSNTSHDENGRRYAALLNRKALLDAFDRGETQLAFRDHDVGLSRWVDTTTALVRNPSTGHVEAILKAFDVTEPTLKEIALNVLLERSYLFVGMVRTSDGKIALLESHGGAIPPSVGNDYDEQATTFMRAMRSLFPSDEEYRQTCDALPLETIRKKMDEDGPFEYRARMKGYEGEMHSYRFFFDYVDDDRSMVLIACSDISTTVAEEQRQQEILSNALADARSASMAKSDFLSHMSHEIRTPLNAIIGMTALAEGEVQSPEAVSTDLAKIGTSARFLLSLINDVLDMSRIESGRMTLVTKEFALSDLIRDIDTVIHAQAQGKGITFDVDVSGIRDQELVGDRTKLEQVIVNILGNSVKFTPAGGRIALRAEEVSRTKTTVRTRFTMSDTGEGMSEEFLPHVFDAFSQETPSVTRSFGGSGLGLAISKNIIDMMGGTIDVTSSKGMGSTFVVEVPLNLASSTTPLTASADQTAQPPAAAKDGAEDNDFNGKRVLLVEDNPLNVEVAKRLLEVRNAAVTVAKNGQVAIQTFSASPAGYFKAILMDINMPVMDGLEATREIRALDHPDATTIPIIAMTADAFEEDIRKSREAGMDAHLSKPIEPGIMYEMLARYLGKGDE